MPNVYTQYYSNPTFLLAPPMSEQNVAGQLFAGSHAFSIHNSTFHCGISLPQTESHSVAPVLPSTSAASRPSENPYASPDLMPSGSHSSPPTQGIDYPFPLPRNAPLSLHTSSSSSFPLHQGSRLYPNTTHLTSHVYPIPVLPPLPPSVAIDSPNISGRNLPSSSGSESELYSQLLLPKKHGFLLWYLEPAGHLAPEGINFGDIGYLDGNGPFNYLFNVCHPAGHAVNSSGVPDGFFVLDVDHGNVKPLPKYSPASYVASDLFGVVRTINLASNTFSMFTLVLYIQLTY